ncbi:hypothetical protein H0X10_00660 [Candidatus Saccharibacteria bacterium]|nr:hypothetical protein [Candidatus Saccharibacteria bacterium]
MDTYAKIAVEIISYQEAIIGPVAVEQAQFVDGLQLDWDKHEATISGDKMNVIDKLVEQYKNLFGQISVEVCKDAASKFLGELSATERPKLLQ